MSGVARKLGIKPGMRALVSGAPAGYVKLLAPPEGVMIAEAGTGRFEFLQLFATRRAEIRKQAPRLLRQALPGALVWISYPKKTSGVESDLSREAVWEAMAPTGWRPVSQIAIDDVWSALRFRPVEDVGKR